MPDGLVFHWHFYSPSSSRSCSPQSSVILSRSRRTVSVGGMSPDTMHDFRREHREAQRPLDAGAVDAQHVRQLLAVGVAPLVDCPLP